MWHSRLYKWLYIVLFPAGLLLVYDLQLVQTNTYLGYREFSADTAYIITVIPALFFAGLLIPAHLRKPSDFFYAVYGIFIVIPYVTLHPIRAPVEPLDFTVFFISLVLPIFIVRLVVASAPTVRVPALLTHQMLVWLVVVLCALGLLQAFASSPASAGFDLENVYVRRLEGREVFQAGSLQAYLNAAVVNGFAPFLAFMAGWRRRAMLLCLAAVTGAGFFYLLGLKAPLFLIVLAYIIGSATRKRRIHTALSVIYSLVLTLFLLFSIEYAIFRFSFVGEYLIRRAFSVPPFLVSAYFDFMSASATTGWSPFHGVIAAEPITFLVGESFLGIPNLNANSNAFIYQLASGGLPTYGLTLGLVAAIFAVLDSAYKSGNNGALMYLGFVYSILLVEQAATTALVSSGIGLLILLNIASGTGSHRTLTARALTKLAALQADESGARLVNKGIGV